MRRRKAALADTRRRFPVAQGLVHVAAQGEIASGFVRGFIATGLLAAVTPGGLFARRTLRMAMQGGVAMAAGIAGANALMRGDYVGVLRATTAGAAGLLSIDYALRESTKDRSDKEKTHEQEAT